MKVYHKIFFQRIDPLIKVLHRLTTEALLNKALRNPSSLRPGELSIVFSIYLASLCSMSETDVEACCGMSKHTALVTYKGAVEHAIAKAQLGDDLAAMQGFVLYLGINRFASGSNQDWAHRAWAFTGLACRLASTMSSDAKPPFEQEMQKRLHLALWYLEHRAREDLGRTVFEPWNMTDDLAILPCTSLPTNARDEDLDPGMTQPPVPWCGWTEISFSLMQVEIATATRMVRAATSLTEKLAIIDACESRVSTEYIQFCNGSLAIHWLAKHVAHVLIMELRFQAYGHWPALSLEDTASWSHPSYHQQLVHSSQLLLDAVDMLDTERWVQGEPQAAQWGWLMAEFLQFWPLIFLLGRLSSQPLHEVTLGDRAWQVAERSFRRWERPENKSVGSPYLEALRQLWSQAHAARMCALSGASQWSVADAVSGDFPMFPAVVFASDTLQDRTLQAEDMGFCPSMMSCDLSRAGGM